MTEGSTLIRSIRRIGFSFGVKAVLDCFKQKIPSVQSPLASISRASITAISPDSLFSKTGITGRGDQKCCLTNTDDAEALAYH